MFTCDCSFVDNNYFWLIIIVLIGLALIILKYSVSSGCCPVLNKYFGKCENINQHGECFSSENQKIFEEVNNSNNNENYDFNNIEDDRNESSGIVTQSNNIVEQSDVVENQSNDTGNQSDVVENQSNNNAENDENIETINLD